MQTLFLAAALLVVAPSAAEVTDAGETGFTSTYRLEIAAPPARVWDVLVRPALWWESSHSFSGSAANLTLDPVPGGCWCETLANGGVEHMRVVHVAGGEMMRLVGGLGPLQAMPVAGVLTVTLKPSAAGTMLVATYAVAGPGLAGIAAPVDRVLGVQWPRLKAAAEAPGASGAPLR